MAHAQPPGTYRDVVSGGIVRYWMPLAAAGSPLARADGESRADYVQRVGRVARGVAAFEVEGTVVQLTTAPRETRTDSRARYISQIATDPTYARHIGD